MNDDDLAAEGFEPVGYMSEQVVERINGFAPGDRVGIMNCELAGAYGKVMESWDGCDTESCRDRCHLVLVDLQVIPPDWIRLRDRSVWGEPDNVKRFRINEVIHVD